MKVLKFGGTSVGSSEMLRRVLDIVKSRLRDEQLIVVVSAFGGVTNKLEELAATAITEPSSEVLPEMRNRHLGAIGDLVDDAQMAQSARERVTAIMDHLEEICQGAQMVGEMTPRTRARILSAGELMSYAIVGAFFESSGLSCLTADSRDLVVTEGDLLAGSVRIQDTIRAAGRTTRASRCRS